MMTTANHAAYLCGCRVEFNNEISFCNLHRLSSEYLDTIRWMAQVTHNQYHDQEKTFLECPFNICEAATLSISRSRATTQKD